MSEPSSAGKPTTPGPEIASEEGAIHDAIARRAYEIHVSGEGGDPVDDWLQAEAEIRGAEER